MVSDTALKRLALIGMQHELERIFKSITAEDLDFTDLETINRLKVNCEDFIELAVEYNKEINN